MTDGDPAELGALDPGEVNKMVMWWDDGQSSKTYYGVEKRNLSTRFSILGEAKVTPRPRVLREHDLGGEGYS